MLYQLSYRPLENQLLTESRVNVEPFERPYALRELLDKTFQEWKHLKNIPPATITFYQSCFKALPFNPGIVRGICG